jgi:hypothetical protein
LIPRAEPCSVGREDAVVPGIMYQLGFVAHAGDETLP